MLALTGSATSSLFDKWWTVRGELVEPANIRRNGDSGVERVSSADGVLYLKRQHNHLYRSLFHPLGRPTVLREMAAITALSKIGLHVPSALYADAQHETRGWRALLVTRALEGFVPLDQWYADGGRERLGEHGHRLLLLQLGAVLGRLHRHHWQHTCLYPKHIFVHCDDMAPHPDIALIDLEKARRRLFASRAARRDMKQLHRHSPMWDDSDWQTVMAGHAAAFDIV